MLKKENADDLSGGGKGRGRKAALLILACLAALLALQFTRLDESRKRFILHLLKQVPYLPGRYYA